MEKWESASVKLRLDKEYDEIELEKRRKRILKKIEAYCLIFLTTREDREHVYRGDELRRFRELCSTLGLEFSSYRMINGGAIVHGKRYLEVSNEVLSEILEECIMIEPDWIPFLIFIERRYRGFLRTDIPPKQKGNVITANWSVVETNQYAVRQNGPIFTYSQQSCIVLIFYVDNGMIILGHWKKDWKKMLSDLKRLPQLENATKIFVICDNQTDIPEKLKRVVLKGLRAEWKFHTKKRNDVYSIRAERKMGQNGVDVRYESHSRNEAILPYGPAIIMPKRNYYPMHFDCCYNYSATE